jgi:predicted transport protein
MKLNRLKLLESIRTITKSSPDVQKVSEEIRVYTEDDHLNVVDDNVKELYSELKSAILTFGNDIEMRPKKHYIAFRRKQGFVSFIFSKSKLKACLNIKIDMLQDPLKKSRDVEGIGHYSTGKREIITSSIKISVPSTLESFSSSFIDKTLK